MKNFVDMLTCEQKAALGNCYVINEDNELIPIISNGDLTIENFKIVIVIDGELSIATAEDVKFYKPESNDFDFRVGESYFCRFDTPEDVVTMLDEYLKRDSYNK